MSAHVAPPLPRDDIQTESSPTPSLPVDTPSDPDVDDLHESDPEPEPSFHLTLLLHNHPITLPIANPDATLVDLSTLVATTLHIPTANQKFLITPKLGLLKPPFAPAHAALRLHSLLSKKIVLLGATADEVTSLRASLADRESRAAARRSALQAARRVKPTPYRDSRQIQDAAKYTFHTLRPLPYLPHPEKSLRFLERLRDDAGIRAAMRKHGFAVGLLTEMDPAQHTTHASRTLGLNRNRGEVIELRLRTDAYDGYRDYKVIRKTLCHELTHNVWGDHDARFWDLCKQIEAEVDRNDYRRHGHALSENEFYNPHDDARDLDDDADHVDAGGWVGGEYVLGTSAPDAASSSSVVTGAASTSTSETNTAPLLSRREVLARAAEARMRQQKNDARGSGGGVGAGDGSGSAGGRTEEKRP